MSFREKSAWGMALLLTAAGLFYLAIVCAASARIGATAPAPVAIVFIGLVIIGSIAVQLVLALSSLREASAPADERERLVVRRAGYWSGQLLAAGIFTALCYFLVFRDGDMLFHLVFGSLIVAQIAEYGFQILFLRRTV